MLILTGTGPYRRLPVSSVSMIREVRKLKTSLTEGGIRSDYRGMEHLATSGMATPPHPPITKQKTYRHCQPPTITHDTRHYETRQEVDCSRVRGKFLCYLKYGALLFLFSAIHHGDLIASVIRTAMELWRTSHRSLVFFKWR